jgi:hypothetical protein
LDGNNISINIPPNTENGKVLRLKNLGLPFPDSTLRGNLYLYVNVFVPKNLSEDVIKKLKKLENDLKPTKENLNYEDGILNSIYYFPESSLLFFLFYVSFIFSAVSIGMYTYLTKVTHHTGESSKPTSKPTSTPPPTR